MDIHSVVTSEVCLSNQLFCMNVCIWIDMEPNLCHIGNFVFVLIKSPPMEAHLSYQDARFGKAIFETEPSLTTDPKEPQFCSKMVIFFYGLFSFSKRCSRLSGAIHFHLPSCFTFFKTITRISAQSMQLFIKKKKGIFSVPAFFYPFRLFFTEK